MTVRLTVDVQDAVLGDIDRAVAEGRFLTREAAVRGAIGAFAEHPELRWPQVIGTRHVIVHGYDRVRLDFVASVVAHELRPFRQQFPAILEELQ